MSSKRHWETIYGSRPPIEVSWHQTEPALSLEMIERSAEPKEASFIDVGGGASSLVDRLLDRGYTDLAVLDISGKALALSRERLGARAAEVKWYEQDVTRFVAPHRFRVWHDRAVFHFLTQAADREDYKRALRRALAPGGHVIIAAFAIGGPTQCSGLDVVQYDAKKMGETLGPEFRLLEEQTELHVTPAGREQKFGYYLFSRVGATEIFAETGAF